MENTKDFIDALYDIFDGLQTAIDNNTSAINRHSEQLKENEQTNLELGNAIFNLEQRIEQRN